MNAIVPHYQWFDLLIILLGMAIVTYVARAIPFLLAHFRLPRWMHEILNQIPPSVMAGLVAIPVIEPTMVNHSIWQPEVIAVAVAFIIGLTGLHFLWGVLISMTVYLVLRQYM